MWITFKLEPTGSGRSVSFTWNPETGEVAGTGDAFLQRVAEEARRDGYMHDTASGLYTEADPLTTWEGMAVLVACSLYRVPAILAAHLPEVDQPDPDEYDVPIIF